MPRAADADPVKPNNFDLARLLLAATVIYFHCYVLSRSQALRPLHIFSGHLAVECFFVISGFLIFASYERCKSLKDYYVKRAKRILPGYWFATAVCLAIAVAFTHSFHFGKFLLANLSFLTFLHPGIEGVFNRNADSAMNGSLWTIKVEVMFYIAVPMLVWLCRKLGRVQVLGAITALSILYRYLMVHHQTLAVQLPGQLSYFCCGALAYYYLPEFKRYGKWLIVPAIAAYIVHLRFDVFLLRPFALSVLVLAFSLLMPEIKGPTRWGDFSYGTYVLHYPIVQTIVAVGLFKKAPWLAVAVVTVLAAGAAVFSWFAVERHWLKSRGHTTEKPVAAVEQLQHASAQSAS
ncbi:MAG: acyltransferase [Acidobacteriaceae bacterium]